MNELKNFLKENRSGYLATVSEQKPKVRPFEFQFEENGKFYFCTANTKEVCKQLKEHPFIEFSTTSKEMKTVRLNGEINFAKNLKIKEHILTENALVRSIYKTPDNPIFEIFYIEHGSVIISDFSGNPPKKA